MPNTSDVRVGAPDQSTTGAILHAPVGTALPTLSSITKTGVSYNQAFTGNEYVSEDGLTLSPSRSTTDIKDWSGSVVRKVLESFDGTLQWTMISTDKAALEVSFGSKHVTYTTAAFDANVTSPTSVIWPSGTAITILASPSLIRNSHAYSSGR